MKNTVLKFISFVYLRDREGERNIFHTSDDSSNDCKNKLSSNRICQTTDDQVHDKLIYNFQSNINYI